MRVLVVLCALLFGCTYQTNYYGAVVDGGVTDMGYHDQFGDYIEDADDFGIFKPGAKLHGNASLVLQAPPPVPAAGQPWPFIFDTPARAGAVTLIDVATRDEKPHVLTISLGTLGGPAPTDGSGNNESEVVAILDVGIGGLSFQVEVDFVWGTQFSLAASRLQLHAVHRLTPGTGALVSPVTRQVGASLSTGVVAHGRQPQRTWTYSGVLNIGNAHHWFVPTFAKSFRIVAYQNNIQMNAMVFGMAGNSLAEYPLVAYPSAEFPVQSNARTIRIIPTNGGVNVYAIIWELAL